MRNTEVLRGIRFSVGHGYMGKCYGIMLLGCATDGVFMVYIWD